MLKCHTWQAYSSIGLITVMYTTVKVFVSALDRFSNLSIYSRLLYFLTILSRVDSIFSYFGPRDQNRESLLLIRYVVKTPVIAILRTEYGKSANQSLPEQGSNIPYSRLVICTL
jgi:hypothetical protein